MAEQVVLLMEAQERVALAAAVAENGITGLVAAAAAAILAAAAEPIMGSAAAVARIMQVLTKAI